MLIAYSLIAFLVLAAAASVFYLRYNSRGRRDARERARSHALYEQRMMRDDGASG